MNAGQAGQTAVTLILVFLWYKFLRAFLRYEAEEEANERLRSELKYLRYRELATSDEGAFALDTPDDEAA